MLLKSESWAGSVLGGNKGCFSLFLDPRMSPGLGHKLGLSPVTKISTQAQRQPHPGFGLGTDRATENTLSPPSAPDTGPSSALESRQAWPFSPEGSRPGVGLAQHHSPLQLGLELLPGKQTEKNKTKLKPTIISSLL